MKMTSEMLVPLTICQVSFVKLVGSRLHRDHDHHEMYIRMILTLYNAFLIFRLFIHWKVS